MDELTREGFAHLITALDRQAEYLASLNEKQDAQGVTLTAVGVTLTAVLEQLRALNDNIIR